VLGTSLACSTIAESGVPAAAEADVGADADVDDAAAEVLAAVLDEVVPAAVFLLELPHAVSDRSAATTAAGVTQT
jgi:hypothetical protein